MVCVGIDVAKDKHDCCILDSEGTTLVDCFTIPNNMDGFKSLLQTIQDCSQKSDKIKVGLEATGHYSCNIVDSLDGLRRKYVGNYIIIDSHSGERIGDKR